MELNILLLGGGGREHALAWKLSQSRQCGMLYVAPGNAGTAACATNVAMSATDFPAIAQFCIGHKIDMVVVGPEDPLVKGIYDFFAADESLKHISVIGPSKDGAQLEGSKDFAKAFMQRHKIPTARYQTFSATQLEDAFAFLKTLKAPYVLKADGLAAGKGVVISNSIDEAREELQQMLTHAKFGSASAKVVIEEYLPGIEVSVFVITDGKNYLLLPEAKDYKRIGEGDTGLNTGGMGAVSPVPFADAEFMRKVEERIVRPTVEGLRKDKIEYRGFIFVGLMVVDGDPFVIEYNCRMGDPETEVVVPRIKNDLVELFMAVSEQKLDQQKIEVDERTAVTVMLVSGGYPGDYKKGMAVQGLDKVEGSLVFHAGTSFSKGEQVVTSGGRVIAVTSLAGSIAEARDLSYQNVGKINFEGRYFRNDIGKDLIAMGVQD